jgi:lysophospholipase L1-like esterase
MSMKQYGSVVAAIIVLGFVCGLSGCASAQSTRAKVSGVDEPSASRPDVIVAPGVAVTDGMYARATALDGSVNRSRLAAAMKRAMNGEKITLGFIGGSITEGYPVTTKSKIYARLNAKWWKETFPAAEIVYKNIAISGTNSYFGVHRVGDNLLAAKPDVVVVEFSVNDGNNDFFRESYESLVRKILRAEWNPAVVLVFTTQDDGRNAQEKHATVGAHYAVPMIGFRDAVIPSIARRDFSWTAISDDRVHPNVAGHAVIAELLERYYDSVLADIDTIVFDMASAESPLTGDRYADARMWDSTMLQASSMTGFATGSDNAPYAQGWRTTTGGSISFDVTARNIGFALFKEWGSTTGGLFDVFIDGKRVGTLNGQISDNQYETVELFRSDAKARHTIEIRKAATGAGSDLTLMGLLLS